MKYSEIRSQIKSGDILAWTHKSWGSLYDIEIQIVRFFTQSEYSHVGVAWVISDRVFVLESVVGGIRIYPLSKCDGFYWIPTNGNWNSEVDCAAMSRIGEQYSKLEAIRSFFVKIVPGEDTDWECAEYVLYVLSKMEIHLNVKATPSAVVEGMLSRPNTCIYLVSQEK